MSEFLLIRHAANEYVRTGKLAGWTPDVHLNEDGRAQAEALGKRLANARIDALYSSPLERTLETAEALLEHHTGLEIQTLESLGEVRYGAWQGAELRNLGQRKLWRAVQINPSRAQFPGGETMREAQMRAVNAIEMLNERHPRRTIAVVSHSDIIRMVLAHYLGVHLDLFQRIEVSPASLSIIRLGFGRPIVTQINETSYLPVPVRHTRDERMIDIVSPVSTLTLDAIGDPGHRVFYLQAAGDGIEPVTFVLEKTQALMLATQIDQALESEPSITITAPPLAAHDRVMFRIGGFALQYDGGQMCLRIEETVGSEPGTPRIIQLWATPAQFRALAERAREVAQRGRSAQ